MSIEYNVIVDKIINGRVFIKYDFKYNDELKNKFIKNSKEVEFNLDKRTNCEKKDPTLERNAVFLTFILNKELNGNQDEEDRKELFVIIRKSNIHEIAYISDKILNIRKDENDTPILWYPDIKDIFTFLNFNDDLEIILYKFVRWVEKKLFYALRLMVEETEYSLSDPEQIDFITAGKLNTSEKKIEKFKQKIVLIKNNHKLSKNDLVNSRILKSLTFGEKLFLFKHYNANNCKIKYLNGIETENTDDDLLSLIALLQEILTIRNMVSHHEFLLTKRAINKINTLMKIFSKNGYLISNKYVSHIENLRNEISREVENLANNFDEEQKNKILKHFEQLIK